MGMGQGMYNAIKRLPSRESDAVLLRIRLMNCTLSSTEGSIVRSAAISFLYAVSYTHLTLPTKA